jgi:hypothetical protein
MTMPESPQWPTNSFPRFMKQIEAVVPAVEGNPEAVLFQSEGKIYFMIYFEYDLHDHYSRNSQSRYTKSY